jgi:hypothetical protein
MAGRSAEDEMAAWRADERCAAEKAPVYSFWAADSAGFSRMPLSRLSMARRTALWNFT